MSKTSKQEYENQAVSRRYSRKGAKTVRAMRIVLGTAFAFLLLLTALVGGAWLGNKDLSADTETLQNIGDPALATGNVTYTNSASGIGGAAFDPNAYESNSNSQNTCTITLNFTGDAYQAAVNGRLKISAGFNIKNNKSGQEQRVTIYNSSGSQITTAASSAKGTNNPRVDTGTVSTGTGGYVKVVFTCKGTKSWGISVVGGIQSMNYTLSWGGGTISGSFKAGAGGSVSPTSYSMSSFSSTASSTATASYGYYFTSWSGGSKEVSGTKCTIKAVNASGTYTANFAGQSYTIAYNSNKPSSATTTIGGSTASTTHITGSGKVTATNGYTLPGYKFIGWFANSGGSGNNYNNVTITTQFANSTYFSTGATSYASGKTVNLYAKWEAITYTLAYSVGDGNVQSAISNATLTFDSGYTVINPCASASSYSFYKKGYYFTGWLVSGASFSGTTAKYNYNNTGNVAISANSTLVSAINTVLYNLTTTEGATITLTAQWAPIKYQFDFYSNTNNSGGTKVGDTVLGSYGGTLSSVPSFPGRAGYTCYLWAIAFSGTIHTLDASTVVNGANLGVNEANVVLPYSVGNSGIYSSVYNIYACWRANPNSGEVGNVYTIGYVWTTNAAPKTNQTLRYNDGAGDKLLGINASTPSFSLYGKANFGMDYHKFSYLANSSGTNLGTQADGSTTLDKNSFVSLLGVNLSDVSTVYNAYVKWTLTETGYTLNSVNYKGCGQDLKLSVAAGTTVIKENITDAVTTIATPYSYGDYKSFTFSAVNAASPLAPTAGGLIVSTAISGNGGEGTSTSGTLTTMGVRQNAGDYTYTLTFTVSSTEVETESTLQRSITYKIIPYKILIQFLTVKAGNVNVVYDTESHSSLFTDSVTAYKFTSSDGVGKILNGEYDYKAGTDGTLTITDAAGATVGEMTDAGVYKATFVNTNANFEMGTSTVGVAARGENSATSNTVTITPFYFSVTFPVTTVYDSTDHYGELTPSYAYVSDASPTSAVINYIAKNRAIKIDGSDTAVAVKNAKDYSIEYVVTDAVNLRVNNAVSAKFTYKITPRPFYVTYLDKNENVGTAIEYEYSGKSQFNYMKPLPTTIRNIGGTDMATIITDINYTCRIVWVDMNTASHPETEICSYVAVADTAITYPTDIIKNTGSYRIYFTTNDTNYSLTNPTSSDSGTYRRDEDYTITKAPISFRIEGNKVFSYAYDSFDQKNVINPVGSELIAGSGDTLTVTNIAQMKNVGEYEVRYFNENYDLTLIDLDSNVLTGDHIVKDNNDGSITVTFTITPITLSIKNLVYTSIYNTQDQKALLTSFKVAPMAGEEEYTTTFNVTFTDYETGLTATEFRSVGIYKIKIVGNTNYILTNTGYETAKFTHNGVNYNVFGAPVATGSGLGSTYYTAEILVEVAKMKLTVTPDNVSENSVYGYTAEQICALITDYTIKDASEQLYDKSIATIVFHIDGYTVTSGEGYPISLDFAKSYIKDSEMAENYELIFNGSRTYYRTVTPAPMTIKINDATFGYGVDYSVPYVYTVAVKGSAVVSEQTSANASLLLNDVLTIQAYTETRDNLGVKAVGGYPLYIKTDKISIKNDSVDMAYNYSITYTNAQLTITKADLEVRFMNAGDIICAYGAAEKPFVYYVFVNGVRSNDLSLLYPEDTALVSGMNFYRNKTHESYSDDAATYLITEPNQLSTDGYVGALTQNNYDITFTVASTIKYIITPITIKVVLENKRVVYGSNEVKYIENLTNSIQGVSLSKTTGAFVNEGDVPVYATSGEMASGATLFLQLIRESGYDIGDYNISIWNMYIVVNGVKGEIVKNGGEAQALVNYKIESKPTALYTIIPRKVYVIPNEGQSMLYGSNPVTTEQSLKYTYVIDGIEDGIISGDNKFDGRLARTEEGTNYNVGVYGIGLGTLCIKTNDVDKGNYILEIRAQDAKSFAINKATLVFSPDSKEVTYGDVKEVLTYGATLNGSSYLTANEGVSGSSYGVCRIAGGNKTYISPSGYSTTQVGDAIVLNWNRGSDEKKGEYPIRLASATLNGSPLAVISGGNSYTDFTVFTDEQYKALRDIETANYIIKFSQAGNNNKYIINEYQLSDDVLANKGDIFLFTPVKEYDGTKSIEVTIVPLVLHLANGITDSVSFTKLGKTGYYADEGGNTEAVNAGLSAYYVVVFFELGTGNYNCSKTYVAFSDADTATPIAIKPKAISAVFQYKAEGAGVYSDINDGATLYDYNGASRNASLRIITNDLIGADRDNNIINGAFSRKEGETYTAADVIKSGLYRYDAKQYTEGNYRIKDESMSIGFAIGKASVQVTPSAGLTSVYGDGLKKLNLDAFALKGVDKMEFTLKFAEEVTKTPTPAGEYTIVMDNYRIFVPEYVGATTGDDVTDCYNLTVDNTVKYTVTKKAVAYNIINISGAKSKYGEPIVDFQSILNVTLNAGSSLYSKGDVVHSLITPTVFGKAEGVTVGSYQLSADIRITDGADEVTANYDISIANKDSAKYIIEKLPVTITPVTKDGDLQIATSLYYKPYVEIKYTVEPVKGAKVTFNLEGDNKTLANGDAFELILCPQGAENGQILNSGSYLVVKKRFVLAGQDLTALSNEDMRNKIANYDITFANTGKLYTVIPARIRINPIAVSVTYGDINISGTDNSDLFAYVYLDDVLMNPNKETRFTLYGSDTIDISGVLTRGAGKDVGIYEIFNRKENNVFVDPVFSAKKNYYVGERTAAQYEITAKEINVVKEDFVKAGDYDYIKVYDGTDVADGIALARTINGAYDEKITFSDITGVLNTKDVLTAASLTAIKLIYGEELKNYTVKLADGIVLRAAITPKEITVDHYIEFAADGTYVRTYDGGDILNTVALTDYLAIKITDGVLANGDDGNVTVKYVVTANGYESENLTQSVKNAGEYAITATLYGAEKDNYSIRSDLSNRKVKINAATLKLTVDTINLSYGENINDKIYEDVIDPETGYTVQKVRGYTVTGLVKGESIEDYLNLDMKPAEFNSEGVLVPVVVPRDVLQDVGTYRLIFTYTAKEGSFPNYTINNSSSDCYYQINKREVVVYINYTTKIYGTSDSAVDWQFDMDNAVISEQEVLRKYIATKLIYRTGTSESVGSYYLFGKALPESGVYAYNGKSIKLANYNVTYSQGESLSMLEIKKKAVTLKLNSTAVTVNYGESVDVSKLFYTNGLLNVDLSEIAERDKIIEDGKVVGLNIESLKLPIVGTLTGENRNVGAHTVGISQATAENYQFTLSATAVEITVNKNTIYFTASAKDNAYEIERNADINAINELDTKSYAFTNLSSLYRQRVVLIKDYSKAKAEDKADPNCLIILYNDNLAELITVPGKDKDYRITIMGVPQEELANGEKPYSNYDIIFDTYTVERFVWVVKAKPTVTVDASGCYTYAFTAEGHDVTVGNNSPKVYTNDTLAQELSGMIESVKYYTSYVPGDDMNPDVFGGYLGDGIFPVNAGKYYALITTKDTDDFDGITKVAEVRITKSDAATYVYTQEKVKYGEKDTLTITVKVSGLALDNAYQNMEFTFDVNIVGRGAGNDWRATFNYPGSDNYQAKAMVCSYVIDKAVLTVDFGATPDFVYDGTSKSVIYSLKGVYGTDKVYTNATYGDDVSSPLNAGSYTVTVSTNSANYVLTENVYDFDIAKAELKVKADDVTIKRGAAQPVYNIMYEGFVNGDDPEDVKAAPYVIDKATDKTVDTNVAGKITMTFKGGEADNYTFVYGTFILTINETKLATGNNNVMIGGLFSTDTTFAIKSEYYANGAEYDNETEKKNVEKVAEELKAKEGKDYASYSKFSVSISTADILSDTITLYFNLRSGDVTDEGSTASHAAAIKTADTDNDFSKLYSSANSVGSVGAGFTLKGAKFGEPTIYYKLVKVLDDGTYKIIDDVTYDGDYAKLTTDKFNAQGNYFIYTYTEDAKSYAILIIMGACVLGLLLGIIIFIAAKKH